MGVKVLSPPGGVIRAVLSTGLLLVELKHFVPHLRIFFWHQTLRSWNTLQRLFCGINSQFCFKRKADPYSTFRKKLKMFLLAVLFTERSLTILLKQIQSVRPTLGVTNHTFIIVPAEKTVDTLWVQRFACDLFELKPY